MQRAVDLYLDMGSTANQAASSENTGASSTYNSNLFQEEVREAIPSRYDQVCQSSSQIFEFLVNWRQPSAVRSSTRMVAGASSTSEHPITS
jgi:hypothetical protein